MGGCRPLSDAEVAAVLESLNSRKHSLRDRALFLLGLRSGFRISELLSLTVGDVFPHGKVSNYVSVARKNMKKKKTGRTVVLHAEAKEAIVLWVKELQKGGLNDPKTPLFKSRQGVNKSISRITAWTILSRTYAACAMDGKLGTHSMRKTFAEHVHEKLGRDIFKTQKALGHASLNSTAAYLSVSQDEIDEAILKS